MPARRKWVNPMPVFRQNCHTCKPLFWACSQTPVWEPLAYKLQLAMPCEARASNTGFPSRSLGTSQKMGLQKGSPHGACPSEVEGRSGMREVRGLVFPGLRFASSGLACVGWASVFLLAHHWGSCGFRSAWADDEAVCPPYRAVLGWFPNPSLGTFCLQAPACHTL